jgi:opacity protein-like surface antigen
MPRWFNVAAMSRSFVTSGQHWSLRGEYSYYDFGTRNFSIPGPAGGTDVRLTASIVTGSINYRW